VRPPASCGMERAGSDIGGRPERIPHDVNRNMLNDR
jgi:hypothetical protein